MPNNSSARQKKQNKKKKTVSPPLHKEDKASKDKASMEDSSLSLFLMQEGLQIKPARKGILSLFIQARKEQSILRIQGSWSLFS